MTFPPIPTINIAKPDNYPRFLVIDAVDKTIPVSSKSVFLITEFLKGILGKSFDAKNLHNGEVFVNVKTQQQATNLLTQPAWQVWPSESLRIVASRALRV